MDLSPFPPPGSHTIAVNNIPESPGEALSFEVYVQASAAPDSGDCSVSDGDSDNPPYFTAYSGSDASVTPFGTGTGWYDLGTVTLNPGDLSSTVTVNLGDSSGVTQGAWLVQTSGTAYDAMGDVTAQSDGLNNVTTTLYNELEEPVQTAEGQILPESGGSATFNNLPQVPGQARNFIVYVNRPSNYFEYSVSENGTGSPFFNLSDATSSPLGGISGGNWYDLGVIQLAAGDTSTALTVTDYWDEATQICLVMQDGSASYTPTGQVATQTDGDGNLSRVGYNPLGEKTTDTAPAANPSEPAAPPVTTYSYDTLGDVTSVNSPLPGTTAETQGTATTAYAYGFHDAANSGTMATGTNSVSTWQGATLPQDSTSTTESQTWTFSNLALSNDISGSSGDQTYSVFVQGANDYEFSVTGGYYLSTYEPPLDASALGSGWSLVGTFTIDADTDSTLVVSHSGSTSDENVCMLQRTSTDTRDANGNVVSHVGATGSTTTYAFNDLGLPKQAQVDAEDGSPMLGPQYSKAGNLISDTDLVGGYTTQYYVNMFGQTYETVQPNPTSGDTALGPITTETYDADGDLLSESLPDPTTGAAGGPTTTFSYDAFGDQISTTDPMLNTSFDVYDLDGRVVQEQDPSGALTSFSYDSFGNEVSQSLPDPSTGAAGGPTTIFTFDADHQTLSLTDPDSNATFWTYTGDGQVATQSQIVALGYNSDGSINTTTAVSSNEYDLAGDLAESVDADGRAIVFSYSTLGQETGETWYPTAADATAGTGSDGSESFSYDVMGNIATAADTAVVSGTSETIAAYGYQYQGRKVMSQTVNLNGLSPQVTLASGYDYNGNRTSFSATIGSTADFLNSYSYDAIGEVTGITQAEQSSASSYNTFAPKGVSFTYNYDALPTGEQLFNSTDIATAESSGDTSNLVATSTDSYDLDSRLTELTYKAQSGGATLASYSYGLDDNGLATSMVYTSNTSAWNEKDTYTNDRDGQLTGTSYAIGQTSGETSTYETTTSDAQTLDSNGNRTQSSLPDSITSAVGAGNRVLYDGTYFYRYDVAGNRIAKFKSDTGLLDSSATDITIYKWNEENELTAVTTYEYYSNYSSATDGSVTDFGYDPFRQMVSTTLAGGSPEYFMYDGTNVALILNASGGVIEREFSGPAADQYFASENGSTGVVNWLLPDAHGTVRDVAQFTPGTDDGPGTTAVVDHVFFTSAGAVTSQTSSSAADQSSFGYDGMWQGAVAATKLNNDDQRWYDAVDSIFANQDPLGFGGGQTNTEEFCGNSPTNATDPSGLMANFSPVNPASWGPLKGTDIGGVGPGSCGCAEGKPVGLMDTPSDSGGGIPVLGNPSNSTWGQTDKRLASGFGNFVLGGTDGRLVSNPPTKEDFAKGDAIENKDANGKTYYYYPHEDNLPKGYKLFAYQTKRGSAFYVQAPDGAYVHRCAYLHGINEMDQWDGHPGGYWGSSHNKNGDEWITYAYDPKTHKLRLRVYDGDPAGAPTPGKLIREQTLDKAPSDPEGLPYPDQVPKINAPAK